MAFGSRLRVRMRALVTVQPVLYFLGMEHRVNSQSRLGGSATNNCEEELPATQRRAGAVAAVYKYQRLCCSSTRLSNRFI
jgi:hypothetical protein